MTHTDKKRDLFTCDICAQRFRRLTRLRRHIRAQHPEELRQAYEQITTQMLQELVDQGVIEMRDPGAADAPGQQFSLTEKGLKLTRPKP